MAETLSIPKSTYLNQAARAARHDPEATLSARLGGRARRAEDELVARKATQGRVVALRRQAVRAARQRLARRGRHPRLPRRRAEFGLDSLKAYLSPEIDCHGGWPACWRLSPHPDKELVIGMLSDLVTKAAPTEERPWWRTPTAGRST